ncbi:MAG: choice-of-anchor D domain-containing protein [Burkholderiaceae bacterium]
MNRYFTRVPPSVLLVALLFGTPLAKSQDALRGKALYVNTNGAPLSCADSACHGLDPTRNMNNILNGANNAPKIQSAIAQEPQMMFLSAYVSNQNAVDIAAYLANPNVAAVPAIAVAPTSVTFASTYVGSASAIAALTVSNSGTGNLVLSSLNLSGANAAEFRVETSSTCRAGSTLATGASCRVNLSFRPTTTGAKSSALTIAHNAAGATISVPLTGSASLPPMPAITVSPAAITFPATTAGSASAVYSVTVANTGTAALVFSAISTAGTNANDFRIEPASTCSVTTGVAPGASCRVELTFRPTVLGSETASLVFAHNAAGGPSSVALNGTATAAAAPTIALSANSLNFGPQEVGTQSALRTITVTNVGTGVLTITTLTAGGSHVADFSRSGSCQAGMSLAASGGNCTLVFSFAPTAVGTRTSNLTIASNNSGGNVTVSLAGNATTNIPVATITPAALTFSTQQVGTSSAAQAVTLGNSGGGRLVISSVAISGLHFTQSGNCVGASLAAGQVCLLSVVFVPSASGSLASTLMVAHGAAGSPLSVALAGVGTTLPVPVLEASPSPVAFPGTTAVGQPSSAESVIITNAGPGSLTLGAISTNSSEFVLAGGTTGGCAAAMIIAQGASCSVDVRFSPAAPGARTGGLSIASTGTPSPLIVALAGDASAVAAPEISSDKTTLDFGSASIASQSPTQPLSLSNTGSTNLDVSAVNVGAPFALAPGGTCGSSSFSLTPGESCVLQVLFAPSATGAQSGTLSLSSNAGTLTISLVGESFAAPPANQNVTAGATPMNAGGGGAFEPSVLLLLILAITIVNHRRRALVRK